MSFPLADWVLSHAGAPHNLALSGFEGSLRSVARVLARAPAPDAPELRSMLGRVYRVPASRIFLTHGATEGNALALTFLAQHLRRVHGRTPRIYAPVPEYPPIPDTATEVGFRRTPRLSSADAVALSSPRNPLGTSVPVPWLRNAARSGRSLIVDQTFREFTDAPPLTTAGIPRAWLVGSLTKIYGASDLRVGFVIPPAGASEGFGRFHGLVLDQLPPASVSGALAILEHRSEILAEARGIFRRNERALRTSIDGVTPLSAPVWFDEGTNGADGDKFARTLLRHGVLVCPGSYFGVPGGVRICLTRRSFPEDLRSYLAVRATTPDFA
ncbi:MAG: pyridoxal phosphate-dependent aminotransferase [Thermoplasmata archaeon]|nr:pyridoxal phosphate-dependent aminotransferase [Thermoplasmata archaeon]